MNIPKEVNTFVKSEYPYVIWIPAKTSKYQFSSKDTLAYTLKGEVVKVLQGAEDLISIPLTSESKIAHYPMGFLMKDSMKVDFFILSTKQLLQDSVHRSLLEMLKEGYYNINTYMSLYFEEIEDKVKIKVKYAHVSKAI